MPDHRQRVGRPNCQHRCDAQCDQNGLDPARCWMTGDRVTDWDAGLNAGIRSCAMRSGAAKPEELAQAAARGFAVHDDFPAFVRAELKLAF